MLFEGSAQILKCENTSVLQKHTFSSIQSPIGDGRRPVLSHLGDPSGPRPHARGAEDAGRAILDFRSRSVTWGEGDFPTGIPPKLGTFPKEYFDLWVNYGHGRSRGGPFGPVT